MANLTRTAAQVACLDTTRSFIYSGICAVDVERGQTVYRNSAGKLALADASAAGTAHLEGLALQPGNAGDVIDYLRRGPVGGFDLSGLAYGASVYQSNDAGELADAAGDTSKIVGRVGALTDHPTLTKYIDFNVDESVY